jgi:hypothetical protein
MTGFKEQSQRTTTAIAILACVGLIGTAVTYPQSMGFASHFASNIGSISCWLGGFAKHLVADNIIANLNWDTVGMTSQFFTSTVPHAIKSGAIALYNLDFANTVLPMGQSFITSTPVICGAAALCAAAFAWNEYTHAGKVVAEALDGLQFEEGDLGPCRSY